MDIQQYAGGQAVTVQGAPIVMYATRFCPFCLRARSVFQHKGLAFEEISVDADPALRAEMMEKSGRHTVPQIWIGDHYVGGCDELVRLEMAGELDELVQGENRE